MNSGIPRFSMKGDVERGLVTDNFNCMHSSASKINMCTQKLRGIKFLNSYYNQMVWQTNDRMENKGRKMTKERVLVHFLLLSLNTQIRKFIKN
jgi:hypothetical protein